MRSGGPQSRSERGGEESQHITQVKGKVVPVLFLTEHHDMEASGQLHTPAALPEGKEPLVSIG